MTLTNGEATRAVAITMQQVLAVLQKYPDAALESVIIKPTPYNWQANNPTLMRSRIRMRVTERTEVRQKDLTEVELLNG